MVGALAVISRITSASCNKANMHHAWLQSNIRQLPCLTWPANCLHEVLSWDSHRAPAGALPASHALFLSKVFKGKATKLNTLCMSSYFVTMTLHWVPSYSQLVWSVDGNASLKTQVEQKREWRKKNEERRVCSWPFVFVCFGFYFSWCFGKKKRCFHYWNCEKLCIQMMKYDAVFKNQKNFFT